MRNSLKPPPSKSRVTRREFMKRSSTAVTLLTLGRQAIAAGQSSTSSSLSKGKLPNTILCISDHFRWDAIFAYGLNSMQLTPNLGAAVRREILFQQHFANQTVCEPSPAGVFSGKYQSKHGVWMNGLGLIPGAVTLRLAVDRGEIVAEHPLPDGPWVFHRQALKTAAARLLVDRARQRYRHAL